MGLLRCRGCITAPPRCPLLLSVHATSPTVAVTAYRSMTKNEFSVNIRLTRFHKIGRLYRTIIAAQVSRSYDLARRDVGSTPSSMRSSPHAYRLTWGQATQPSV